MTTTKQVEKAARFRAMHTEPGILVLPNAWDPGSAILMQIGGAKAIATTSSGIAFSQGYPDAQALGREGMLAICAAITAAVNLPVSFDLEAGYGPEAEDVAKTVLGAIAAGGVGCNIEDGTRDRNAPLTDFSRAVERIRAGADAANVAGAAGADFVLNARTDAFLRRPGDPDNFAETVKRAHAYREAGARCIFVPGVTEAEPALRLQREIGGPLNLLVASGGRATPLTVAGYAGIGIKRISIGGSLAEAALALVLRGTREVCGEAGTFSYAPDGLTHPELNKMMIAARA